MNDTTLTLLELLLKGSALLCLGFSMSFVWRRSSAAQRSLVWLVIFAILGLLPASLWMHPVWPVPVTFEMTQASALPTSARAVSAEIVMGASAAPPKSISVVWGVADFLFVLYILGVIVVVGYRLLGTVQLVRLRRLARPAEKDSALSYLFEKISSQRARLRISSSVRVPMTWGTWRPVILLPAGSESWPEAELEAALQHELAHIRHRDPLRRWLGTLVCALWWPLPFVWLASRVWRLEQERACDDAVIRSGADPQSYAAQLLATARQWQRHRFQTTAALVMAMPAGLEVRLRSVVATSVNRAPLGRGIAGWVIMVGLSIALLAFGFRAQSLAMDTGRPIYIQAKFFDLDSEVANGFALPPGGSSTLTEPQMQALLRVMSQTKGVDMLSAPRIEAKSGQAAQVEVVREFGPAPSAPSGQSTPPRSDMKEIGAMLYVTPREVEDGRVSLDMAPLVRDFHGYRTVEGKDGKQRRSIYVEATWKGTVPLRPREWYLQRLASPPLPAEAIRTERQKWVLVSAEAITHSTSASSSSQGKPAATESTVTIFGAVRRQGKYTLKPGMTLGDLIQQAQGLAPAAASQADLWRGPKHSPSLHFIELNNGASFSLEDGDRVMIYTKAQSPKKTASLSEDVEVPFTNPAVGVLPEAEKRQQAILQLRLLRKRSTEVLDLMDQYDNTELSRSKVIPPNAADPDSMWRQQVERANEVLRSHGLGAEARGRL